MFGTVTRYDNQKGYGFIRKKEGLISQPLMVYNLLRKVVGGENSDLPSVRLEKKQHSLWTEDAISFCYYRHHVC